MKIDYNLIIGRALEYAGLSTVGASIGNFVYEAKAFDNFLTGSMTTAMVACFVYGIERSISDARFVRKEDITDKL